MYTLKPNQTFFILNLETETGYRLYSPQQLQHHFENNLLPEHHQIQYARSSEHLGSPRGNPKNKKRKIISYS